MATEDLEGEAEEAGGGGKKRQGGGGGTFTLAFVGEGTVFSSSSEDFCFLAPLKLSERPG